MHIYDSIFPHIFRREPFFLSSKYIYICCVFMIWLYKFLYNTLMILSVPCRKVTAIDKKHRIQTF